MKIQAIRIKNLASLDGTTEIDFTCEPLCSAGIFAITGPTGAGKSTILDALCLALYARTPRYRMAEHGVDITDVKGCTIKQDDVRGILRDGTSDGYAEVDFEGIDGECYRAGWSVRRSYNRADGNLKAFEISLKNITTDQDIPGRKSELLAEIERLVGLNFEQFTRSVLLAQGDFTAFLKAGKDEKSSLLEKLTGTYIYSEISKKIFEHYREEQQKLRDLNLKCEGIHTFTTEELYELQEQKSHLKTVIEANEKERDALEKEINWHEQWLKLQESVQSAQSQYKSATAAKTEAYPRELQLEQIIRIQPVRSIISDFQNVQKQIGAKKSTYGDISSKQESLKEQIKISVTAFEQVTATLETAVQEEEKAQPLLNIAKALDIQLSEKEAQVKRAAEEFASVTEKEAYQKTQLSLMDKELEGLIKEIGELSRWKTENESRQSIAEQENLILSKLGDAEGMQKDLYSYSTRIHDTEQNVLKNEQEKQTLEDKTNALQASRRQRQDEFQRLHTTLSAIPIQDLEKEKSALDHSIEDMIGAEAHWKILYQAINDKENISQSLQHSKKELEHNKTQLSEAEELLRIKKVKKETSLKILEKARLVSAESVERLRNQLEAGEPCPVCGSTSHPYAVEYPLVDRLLSELEAAHAQNESAYTHQLTLHSSTHQICIGLEKSIAELEETLSDKNSSFKELEARWSEFLVSKECDEYPFSERSTWLQEQLQQHKSRQRQLSEQIQSYGRQKEQLESYQNDLVALDKQLSTHENLIKDNERMLKSLRELQKNDTTEHQKAVENLDKIKQTLTVYFLAGQWFENWQKNPETFVHHIREFTRAWKTNTTRLEELIHQQKMLAEKRKGMAEQLKNIEQEVKDKGAYLSGLEANHKELSDQRMAIFNGELVIEIETKLKESIHSAKLLFEEQKKSLETIQADIIRNEVQLEQLEKDISVLTQQESALDEQLGKWIIDHNQQYNAALIREELFSFLEFTQDWIAKERADLREIDNAEVQAKSILDERNKVSERHSEEKPSDRTLDELIVLQLEIKESLSKSSLESNEIDFKIKEDKSNKERIGSLLKEIEKQAEIEENWAKLYDIIGSADGKKFRQIAQEYTLDVLLSYANVHLEILSKRYVLQRIPNSLGLQVIDQDMGDEVRTVYSLSGGESFLVSLALALGLASLSSSRMKVESLFIDEGFGSLDPNTLNIAMDALERLYSQGRKVGVISHVQEMTERIPVQIKVSKQQSGKSKVEVVGYDRSL